MLISSNIHTKLRYCETDNFVKKEYLTKLDTNDALKMMELRLQMNDIKTNYKGKHSKNNMKCPLCMISEDTNEHQIQCTKIENISIKNGKQYHQYLQSDDQDEIKQFLRKIRINEDLRSVYQTKEQTKSPCTSNDSCLLFKE